ncbi:hypothetical protein OUZ56_027688 [Daphnia magna]|uniref:Uncharacterized protein n=1 Tax=Daphnia magna TaxID=35525 RepID=A0ABR0B1M2_9CRUS|nr:hypothetical protein OUZ56_027688 [Daphnia magna]
MKPTSVVLFPTVFYCAGTFRENPFWVDIYLSPLLVDVIRLSKLAREKGNLLNTLTKGYNKKRPGRDLKVVIWSTSSAGNTTQSPGAFYVCKKNLWRHAN